MATKDTKEVWIGSCGREAGGAWEKVVGVGAIFRPAVGIDPEVNVQIIWT